MRFKMFIGLAVFWTSASAQDILSADSTLLFRLSESQLHAANDSVLYTINGNIIFSGDSRDKEHMLYLIRSEDIFSREVGMIYNPSMSETHYSLHRGRIYLGPEPTLEFLLLEAKATNEELVVEDYRGHVRARWMLSNQSLSNANVVAILIALVQHYGKDSLLVGIDSETRDDVAVIRPYWNDLYQAGYHEWTWDGRTLRPRYGNRPEDEWTFDGRYLKPAWYRDFHDEWEWSDDRFEPAWAGPAELSYIWDGRTLRPFWGAQPEREWVIEEGRAKPKWGNNLKLEWVIEGDVPIAVVALVVLGLADR